MSPPSLSAVDSRGGRLSETLWTGLAFTVAIVVVTVLFLGLSPVFAVGLLGLLVAAATLWSAIEVVDAYEKDALTVFGEYRGLLEPGIHLVPPFVSRSYSFDIRTRTIDIDPQEAITRDNSPVRADAIVYYRIVDVKKAFLEVEEYERAIATLAQTTLRAVLGDMELDDTLSRREEINSRIRRDLDEPTDEWGIRIEAVEVREVSPSPGVKSAMEDQSSAERRRRAMILEAQGERRSAIETAEGAKQATVVRAQGTKQSQILAAQGDAISTVLRAKSAESMGERAIIERGMESLERIGEGASSTFIIPQELTSLVGRYGGQLTGGTASSTTELESHEFDDETREMLGLDNIEALLTNLDFETTDLSTTPADAAAEAKSAAEAESAAEAKTAAEEKSAAEAKTVAEAESNTE